MMTEIDWSKAPEWADRVVRGGTPPSYWWANDYTLKPTDNSCPQFKTNTHINQRFQVVGHRPGTETTPTAEPDMVNHPLHYQSDNGIECIDAIWAALGREGFIAYCRGSAIKYLWRDKVNNVEDRNKAAWYINRANAEEQSCQQ